MAFLEKGGFKKLVSFVKSPVTEMIVAACIDLSRNFLFEILHQYFGSQIIFSLIQLTIIIIPWIMLGHGALRFPQKTNDYHNLDYYESNNKLTQKNTNFLSLLIISSLAIKIISV